MAEAAEWYSTRNKNAKRKRSVLESDDATPEASGDLMSQDVLGLQPLKRSRVTTTNITTVPITADVDSAAKEESAAKPAEVELDLAEALEFIQHNYLSGISALMYSIAQILFPPGGESELDKLDKSTYEQFIKDFYSRRADRRMLVVPLKKELSKQAKDKKLKSVLKEKGLATAKRRPSAYQVFMKEEAARIREKEPDRRFEQGELLSTIAQRWKELSEEDRMPYIETAAKASRPEATTPSRAGWREYKKEHIKRVKEANPNMLPADQLALLQAEWDALTPEQREAYAETAAALKRDRTPTKSKATLSKTNRLISGTLSDDEGQIVIRSRRRLRADALANISNLPSVVVVDLTINSTTPHRKFAFATPLGGIPIPLGRKAGFGMSVEGIVEGLKVFEKAGVDRDVLANQKMRGIRRTEKKNGKLLGWSQGLKGHSDGEPLLNAESARWKILFPAYHYVLTECLSAEVKDLKRLLEKGKRLVLLDADEGTDVYDYTKPLAAAELLRRYLLNQWPSREEERRIKAAKPAETAATSTSTTTAAASKKGKQGSKDKASQDKASKGKDKSGGDEDKEMEVEKHQSENIHWDSQVSVGDDQEEEDSSEEEESDEEEEEEESEEEEEEEETD